MLLLYKTCTTVKTFGKSTNFHFAKISAAPAMPFSCYICAMPDSFSQQVIFNKKPLLAVIVPQLRKDGMYYEVNIKGYPRFYMSWSALDRFDLAEGQEVDIPYQLVLAVSDVIESHKS